MSLTKNDLVEKISEKINCNKLVAKDILEYFFIDIIGNLKRGDKIELRNFGVFEAKIRKAKLGRNPKTKEEVTIPSRRGVVFRPGKIMREKVEISYDE